LTAASRWSETQTFGRAALVTGTVYSDAQVLAQLTNDAAKEQWIFDRLLANGVYASDLTPYVRWSPAPTITHDITSAVGRRLRMVVRGDAPLAILSDLIRPHYQIRMSAGDWVDWALGTFTLVPNLRDIAVAQTWIQLEGYDLGQLLVDGAFSSSTGFPAGTSYLAAINSIVASLGGNTTIPVLMADSGKTLPAALTWEYGKTRLSAINDLLTAQAYDPLWFDEVGRLRSEPIPDYNVVAPTYNFDGTNVLTSVIVETIGDRPDISRAYNQVLVVAEDPRRPPISALYQNNKPNDPVSIVNWHPKLLVIRMSSIADQATALAYARAKAQEAARYYFNLQIKTQAWPVSQNRDVYRVVYQTAQEGLQNWLYLEMGWEMKCGTGELTSHSLQRILLA